MVAGSVPVFTGRDLFVVAGVTAATLGLGIWLGIRFVANTKQNDTTTQALQQQLAELLKVQQREREQQQQQQKQKQQCSPQSISSRHSSASSSSSPVAATAAAAKRVHLKDLDAKAVESWLRENGASEEVLGVFVRDELNGRDVIDFLDLNFGFSPADKLVFVGLSPEAAVLTASLLQRLEQEMK